MKFDYEELEGGLWRVSFTEMDIHVVTRTKDGGTEALLAVLEDCCHSALAFYGRLLGEVVDAQETLGKSRGQELH